MLKHLSLGNMTQAKVFYLFVFFILLYYILLLIVCAVNLLGRDTKHHLNLAGDSV